jgi:MFS family permease
LILKKLTPSRWISFIATSWGIIATLTGLVQNYGGLIACRLLLGLVEGGLFPGMAVYLTMFYSKKELGLRIGTYYGSPVIQS